MERELLPGHSRLVHQAALRDAEHGHAFVVMTDGARILLSAARAGPRAIGGGRRACLRRDRDHLGISAELEVTGLELVRRALVREEDDFAVSLTARLKADAHLPYGRLANLPAANENLA